MMNAFAYLGIAVTVYCLACLARRSLALLVNFVEKVNTYKSLSESLEQHKRWLNKATDDYQAMKEQRNEALARLDQAQPYR